MFLLGEVLNLIWLGVGVVLAVSGYVIFRFSPLAFYKLGIGLPVGLIGITVTLFKIHELILVLVKPSRIKAICIFCNRSKD